MFAKACRLPTIEMDRRSVLRLGLVGALATTMPLVPTAAAPSVRAQGGQWRTSLHNPHTGESFSGIYRVGDTYRPDAFARLNVLLRDQRSGEVFPMDPRLLDILHTIQMKAGIASPIEVICGYRSPVSNSALRKTTRGVAKNSFHMYGQAVDLRVTGYDTKRLFEIAKSLKAGGASYYGRSNFVHVDTGPVRTW